MFGGPPGGAVTQAEPRALSRILMHGSTNKSTKVDSALIPKCLGLTSHMCLTCGKPEKGVLQDLGSPCSSDPLLVLVLGPG